MVDVSKESVRDFWDAASCGEIYATGVDERQRLETHSRVRYQLEPYLRPFARFADGHHRAVLEVGVGMGADHVEWAKSAPSRLAGVDLTARAAAWTTDRLCHNGFEPHLAVGDAEHLPFPNDSFDIVYSWGVLHHSPDTQTAFHEVYRVLRPGGIARVMIYHRRSIVAGLLWLRYALLAGQPRRSLDDILASHLESPGTKAYTVEGARYLARAFTSVTIKTQLSLGDLLEGGVGQQHDGRLLRTAKRIWPRPLIRRWLSGCGLFLLIEATK